MPPNRPTLEICVDDMAGLHAASRIADRIELCAALCLGGLTPSPGLIAAARESAAPVHMMIRPRAGDFDYDTREVRSCLSDIAAARAAGCAGVVVGAMKEGSLNIEALRQMRIAAEGMAVTLHRCVDLLPDPAVAIGVACELGIARILTSGGAVDALSGLATLKAMAEAAGDTVEIMAGAGITPANVGTIAKRTGIRAFHASASRSVKSDMACVAFGFAPPVLRQTDPRTLDALRLAVDAVNQSSNALLSRNSS